MNKNEIHCIHMLQGNLICLLELNLFCIQLGKAAKL